MCDKEVKIQVTDEIEKIMVKNLQGKSEKILKKINSCKECPYSDKVWVWGDNLYCCSYNNDNPSTSRNVKELYENCPLNHEIEITKSYIKRYGIIHNKPKNGYYSKKGSISVVDFSKTTFEWDGCNPDVDWEPIIVFYYKNQDEATKMMKLAYEYYNDLNLDGEYCEKHCYG